MSKKDSNGVNNTYREFYLKMLKARWKVMFFLLPFLLFLIFLNTNILNSIENIHEMFVPLIFIACIISMIYGLYSMYGIDNKIKQISFQNYQKSSRIGMILIVSWNIFNMTGVMALMFISYSHLLWAFLGFSIIILFGGVLIFRVKYSGTLGDYYNNIIVRYGQKINSIDDGYTERPYSMKIFKPDEAGNIFYHLENYGKKMMDHLIISGYERYPENIIFYPPSPDILYGVSGLKKEFKQSTRITVYFDGLLSIHVSRNDYDRIGTEVTYHELCQILLKAFASSIKKFIKGDEKGAVETLSQKGYIEARRKKVRNYRFFLVRICAVLIVLNILISAIPITTEKKVLDTTLNTNDESQISSNEIKLKAYHYSPFIMKPIDTRLRNGDEFLIIFSSNSSINEVYVYGYAHDEDNQIVYYTITKTLLNVTKGEIKLKIKPEVIIDKDSYSSFLLEEYYLKLNYTDYINRTSPEIHIEIKQLNAANIVNYWIAIIICAIYLPSELYFKRISSF